LVAIFFKVKKKYFYSFNKINNKRKCLFISEKTFSKIKQISALKMNYYLLKDITYSDLTQKAFLNIPTFRKALKLIQNKN